MRRHILITAAVLLLAGCSTDDTSSEPSAKPSASTETSPSETAVPKLSEEWGPKLDAAGDDADEGVCTEVGAPSCVEHLTALTEVVYDVEAAIESAGAADVYPRSMKQADAVTAASEGYVAAQCEGSSDNALGDSVCAGYAATLLLGPATLSVTMKTDEYSR